MMSYERLGHVCVCHQTQDYWLQSSYLTSDEGETHGELRRDFGDEVGGEVAGGEGGLAHQVEDRVRHLHQLAGGEV